VPEGEFDFLGYTFGRMYSARTGKARLALQLPSCFEMCALCDRLMSSAPERPCDDVCGLDPLSGEPDGDAADFLDRPTDQ